VEHVNNITLSFFFDLPHVAHTLKAFFFRGTVTSVVAAAAAPTKTDTRNESEKKTLHCREHSDAIEKILKN